MSATDHTRAPRRQALLPVGLASLSQPAWLALLTATLLVASAADAGALRDPTRPLASDQPRRPGAPTAAPAPPVLPTLQLVLTSAGRRYAVIDGELLAVGDQVRGMRLLQVKQDAVVLSTPNGPRSLLLNTD